MSEELLQNMSELPPHKYPLWVNFFAGLVIIATIYSLALLPKYLVAAKKMHVAKEAYAARDYSEAISLYRSVLETIPTSEAARIGAAEAIFANGDKSDDEGGLELLSGITLNKSDWVGITQVMPTEYQQYFDNIKQ